MAPRNPAIWPQGPSLKLARVTPHTQAPFGSVLFKMHLVLIFLDGQQGEGCSDN